MSRFENLEFDEHARDRVQHTGVVRDEAFWLQEAQTSLAQGEFEQALRAFARVLEFNPNSVAAWTGQVRMLIELEEFREANLWSDKALERFPNEAELLAAKGVALARLGDAQAALTFSDAAVAERGDSAYVWLARGDVLLARSEKRADYCFDKALGAAPREWLWPWLASRVHAYYRKFALALKFIAQALALDGSQGAIWLQMGRCQLALGLADAARNSFEQAKQLNPRGFAAATALMEMQQLGFWERLAGQCRRWFAR